MRHLFMALCVALAVAICAAPQPAFGDKIPAPEPRAPTGQAIMAAYERNLRAGQFEAALAAAEQLRPTGAEGEAARAGMRAAALIGLRRDQEAKREIDKAERLAPKSSFANYQAFAGALIAKRYDVAADAIDRLIMRTPAAVRELDWKTVYIFLRNEPDGQDKRNEDRRVTLARMNFAGPEFGDSLAQEGAEILMRRGDAAGASELLGFVDDPRRFEKMLIRKRFQPLWPRLEQLAGPRLEKVRASHVATAQRAYAAAPNDSAKLNLYIRALKDAGRHSEAIALKARVPQNPQTMSAADEDLGWAVNEVAGALYHAGRGDEGDALYSMLNRANIPDGSWRISMKINQVDYLAAAGKFDRAAALLADTEAATRTKTSSYGRQAFRATKSCVLGRLGRTPQASAAFADMMAHAEDAPVPTINALLCLGDLNRAEQLALATLPKKKWFEADFVWLLQRRKLVTSDPPSVWDDRWLQLRQRPAIVREFDRLGRDMPEHLLPG